jgi:hypothetical protein
MPNRARRPVLDDTPSRPDQPSRGLSISGAAAGQARAWSAWWHADRVIVAIFVASGAAGLMYQVVWSQQLVLVFGNTTEASGRSSLPSWLASVSAVGWRPDRASPAAPSPRVWRGGGGGGWDCPLVPEGLQLIADAYRTAYDTTGPGQLTLARLLLTMAALTQVTFLNGLTLPLLTRHLVDSMRTAGARMGQLYGANTLGAMAGTLCSGLLLSELLGFSQTARVAVALNVLAGCVAVLLSLGPGTERTEGTDRLELEGPAPVEHRRREEHSPGPPSPPGLRGILYVATFLSGFVARRGRVPRAPRRMCSRSGSQRGGATALYSSSDFGRSGHLRPPDASAAIVTPVGGSTCADATNLCSIRERWACHSGVAAWCP